MAKPNDFAKGQCRCGKVRFEVASQPLLTMACHCTGCQRMTASAFALTAMMAAKAFAVTHGEPVVGGTRMGGGGNHYFCDFCKCRLFTKPDGGPIVNVRPTMLENAQWSTPFIEVFTIEKLAWAVTPAVHSFERFPDWGEFEMLSEAFAKRSIAGV